jgi:hypothetical protein
MVGTYALNRWPKLHTHHTDRYDIIERIFVAKRGISGGAMGSDERPNRECVHLLVW